jgi:phosphocarrier protein NPr
MSPMICVELTITNKLGLHARAAAKLASTTGKYGCVIKTGRKPDKLVDAKSVMSLMLLAASQGTTLYFHFEGDDAKKAHKDVEQLIANRFDEEQ